MSSSSAAFSSLDHHHHLSPPPPPSEQLCYVQCNFCDTVLAVSVPCSSLFKTVTVRCGHCTNLFSVNLRHLLLPAGNFGPHCFLAPPPPPPPNSHHNLTLDDQMAYPPSSNMLMDPPNIIMSTSNNFMPMPLPLPLPPTKCVQEEIIQAPPPVNRPPEKRQRVPSAYNRFIKDEIRRIKAGNPDITHREAFSAAAKNWAHFPHIHFGLMPDQGLKMNSVRHQQEVDQDVLLKDGFYAAAAAAAANMGVTPF